MDIKHVILATLTALTTGCSSDTSGGCPDSRSQPFTFNEELTENHVDNLLAQQGQTDPAKLDCAEYCEDNSGETRVESITVCELKIDAELSGDPNTVAGTFHCEGTGTFLCQGGRRPLGHIEVACADPGLPAFLAACARLEAASVHAFSQLAARLTAWGAPADLVDRCHRAADEEETHAALLGGLAREAGATVEPATQLEVAVDLARAALDNAVEGCVNEAWAALACAVTARHADDRVLREVYARLAADEAGHAQLAWDLHAWFLEQVTAEQRADIVAAQQRALADLPMVAGAQRRSAPPALALPGAHIAASFAAGLARAA